tara:strand:+ start:6472 stop:9018 length:2547 start_codon:yes stop_codon:yes gene_type:complete
MKKLQLYEEPQLSAIDIVQPRLVNSGCMLCPLHEQAKTVCMSAEGTPGGLLIVGGYPGIMDDAKRRPFVSTTGAKLRRMLLKHWQGPIALDYGIKCKPGSTNLRPKIFEACRPYLAQTIAETKPQRILALGSAAATALLGRGTAYLSTRKGFGWITKDTIPVFTLIDPVSALHNRFLAKWFEEDLEWSLNVELEELKLLSSRNSRALLISSKAESKRAVAKLKRAEWISYDCETVGLQHNKDFEIISIAVTGKAFDDAYVWSGIALKDPAIREHLLDMMEDADVLKVAQNGKFDSNALYCAYGTVVDGLHMDTRLVRKILEPESKASLGVMQELVGMGGGKEIADNAMKNAIKVARSPKTSDEELRNIGPKKCVDAVRTMKDNVGAYSYGLLPAEIRDRYCGRDAISTARLGEVFEIELEENRSLHRVWKRVVRPAAIAIEYVERWGVATSADAVDSFRIALEDSLSDVLGRIYASNPDINLNSTLDVRKYLYKQHKMPVISKTKSGEPSTDKETLVKLLKRASKESQVQALEDLLAYRKLSKLHSTYAMGFAKFIRDDGRVHPSFDLSGARSGRISCRDPNLQQVPRPSADNLGGMARNCFVANKGSVLVQLDYSQLELRVAAMLSQDDAMRAIFQSGKDYHQRTAEMISNVAWGISPEDVTKEHRTKAKSVNFGLLYGMSVLTLSKNLNCSVTEADNIRRAIFGKFPKLKSWCDGQLYEARKTGVTWTQWQGKKGRVRPLFRIADADDKVRVSAENGSWNTPVQGTASDLCLASLARCVAWILREEFPAKLVLTVHDSLLFEVDETHMDELICAVKDLMTRWATNDVPLTVDCEIGYKWGELEEMK